MKYNLTSVVNDVNEYAHEFIFSLKMLCKTAELQQEQLVCDKIMEQGFVQYY